MNEEIEFMDESGWGSAFIVIVIFALIIFLGWLFSGPTKGPTGAEQGGESSATTTSGYACYSDDIYFVSAKTVNECDAEVAEYHKQIRSQTEIKKRWCNAHTPKELTLDEYLTCQSL